MLVLLEGYSWMLCIWHLIALISLHHILLLVLPLNRLLGKMLGVLSHLMLAIVYTYAVFANHLWGKFLSFRMIAISWLEWESCLEALSLASLSIQWTLLGLLLVSALALYAWLSLEPGKQKQSAIWKKLWPIAACALVPLGYSSGEPISNTIKTRVYPDFPETRQSFISAVKDLAERKQYSSGKTGNGKHVILIMIDALRADHMSVYGYERPTTPFLDRLAKQSSWHQVEWAFSSCPYSLCGVPSTLASRTTAELGMSHFALHHVLKRAGYEVNFFLSGYQQSYYFLDHAHASSIDRFKDGTTTGRGYDDELVIDALEELRKESASSSPQLLYLHLMSAHMYGKEDSAFQPYQPIPESVDWRPSGPIGSKDSMAIVNTYDNGVRQADAYLEKIWQQLGRLDLLDQAVVFITADHGEGLGEFGAYGHGEHLFPGSIRIPIIMIDQDTMEYDNLFFGRQIDVAPTMLDRLGISVPEQWEGKSLALAPAHQSQALIRTMHAPGWCGKIYRQDSILMQYAKNEVSGEEFYLELTGPSDQKIPECCTCQ